MKKLLPYVSSILPDGQSLDHDDTVCPSIDSVAANLAALGKPLTMSEYFGAPASVLLAYDKLNRGSK